MVLVFEEPAEEALKVALILQPRAAEGIEPVTEGPAVLTPRP